MKKFEEYLDETGEVGYVKKVYSSICYIEGLPNLRLSETVIFENGSIGMAFSLNEKFAEIVIISNERPKVGDRIARTAHFANIGLGEYLLGSMIDPLGLVIKGTKQVKIDKRERIDKEPMNILGRKEIQAPFYTGVKLIDIIVPLGRGQRELIIGDMKTGKTMFLLQIILKQVQSGSIVVYAGIGKKQQDVDNLASFLEEEKLSDSVVSILSAAADSPGKIYLTPYSALTVAEYFRDQGRDVVVILDDMTTHARYYREVSLEAKRFPGRSSYPGDIFYAHARIMERAGNFEKGSITCLPIADTVMGDLSGFIQTNLMSMTDGHIYFDIDRYNQGLRPAVNPFLSVTRVGLQAQSPLVKDASRQITTFLIQLEQMKDFLHFGAEAGDQVKQTISLGDKVMYIFQQDTRKPREINITLYLLAMVWSGFGKEQQQVEVEKKFDELFEQYDKDEAFSTQVNKVILGAPTFKDLISAIRQ